MSDRATKTPPPVEPPPPGSRQAVALGCKCPILDNEYGRGIGKGPDGNTQYWITEGCPLHAPTKAGP